MNIDQRTEHGPFDIIGDVHGCFEELIGLLEDMGYKIDPFETGAEDLITAIHPDNRMAFFLGDLTDRGPRNLDCLRLVMGMCAQGSGCCVMGNHDQKLGRWLDGKKQALTHGLDVTVAELELATADFREKVADFIRELLPYAWLADGQLVIVHAGLKTPMIGKMSPKIRTFAIWSETTGEVDQLGYPIRVDWAADYNSDAALIHGHTPADEPIWRNNTLCIDTGCVYGRKLTALRWPEREIVSTPALRQYAPIGRPFITVEERQE